ncbi:MAG: MoxR family ATPase [Bacteroidia bacterium]|nr:MoxR family ATPase [Bacteroidia bacterium]MDW8345999.1 MoxR family ATPase [Bacteroidia bacterium]
MEKIIYQDAVAAAQALGEKYTALTREIAKQIVGQEDIVRQLLTCIFSQGHCLLVGVPGLAKTLLVRTLADALGLSFNRIQFTPDLMPSDITGSEILEDSEHGKQFRFIKGPVFANIVLADEINRTPPKTQAALLEAMQEFSVTNAGKKYTLELPFFVLATQNPIEQEGTYPLPEAQLDRFMFNIWVDYPSYQEEVQIVKTTTTPQKIEIEKILSRQEILYFQKLVREVPVADNVIEYAVKLVHKTRIHSGVAPDIVKKYVSWGAGPRASQYLIIGAKANALIHGKYSPDIEDVQAVAQPILRHRVILNFNAEADGITILDLVNKLL